MPAKLLARLDTVGRETGRNRSDMLDRAVEFYLLNHPDAKLAK